MLLLFVLHKIKKEGDTMSNLQKNINKISKALKVKGMMPLINHEQFFGDNGMPVTRYIIHYGNPNPRSKNNDIVATVYGKVDLLKVLIGILKAGDSDGG